MTHWFSCYLCSVLSVLSILYEIFVSSRRHIYSLKIPFTLIAFDFDFLPFSTSKALRISLNSCFQASRTTASTHYLSLLASATKRRTTCSWSTAPIPRWRTPSATTCFIWSSSTTKWWVLFGPLAVEELVIKHLIIRNIQVLYMQSSSCLGYHIITSIITFCKNDSPAL